MPIPSKHTFTTATFLLSLLTINGCATMADTTSKKTVSTVQTTQVAVDNAISEREKLVDLLVQTWSADKFAETAINSNPNENPKLLECIGSAETISKMNGALNEEITKTVVKLSDDEVIQYINYLENGGLTGLQKLYTIYYNVATKQLNSKEKVATKQLNSKEKTVLKDTVGLLSNLNQQEKFALFNFHTLANEEVRKEVFPRDDSLAEQFRTMLFTLQMRWAMQDNCMQFIKK